MSRVNKLDDLNQFDAIPSHLKTLQSLRKHEAERYSVWYNHYKEKGELVSKNKSNILWVGENWDKILKYIKDTYDNDKYSKNTLRNHLEGLANILLAIDKKKFKEIVRPLYNTGLSIQQVIDKQNEESVLSAKDIQNFVPEEDLVNERNKLYELWRKDPKNLKLNMYHLILAVNTYIPPLRLNWVGMTIYPPRLVDGKIIKKKKKDEVVPPPPEDETNYLWEHSPGKWSIVMNFDKVENKRIKKELPRQIMNLEDEIQGVTDGHKLNEIINESLLAVPRNFVLIGIRTKLPMDHSSYDAALFDVFRPKHPRQNLIRKAYINYWHRARINGLELPESKLKEIANRMRHSLAVARGSYKKINVLPIELHEYEGPKVRKPPEIKIAPPKAKDPSEYFNPVAYSRQYRKDHATEIASKKKDNYEAKNHEILRDKELHYLNHGSIKKPTQNTIEKYQLYYDDFEGKWNSSELE